MAKIELEDRKTLLTPPSRVGVIDLGSNTVLLLVLERGGRVVREESRITRLGKGVFPRGPLDPGSARKTRDTVCEFSRLARESGAELVVAVGTEALRRAEDAEPCVEELCAAAALDGAGVLTGDQEAEFAIAASRRTWPDTADLLVVVDVGGGSTEVAVATPAGVRSVSLPIGSIRLTEAFLPHHPIPEGSLERVRFEIAEAVRDLAPLEPGARVVAVAGTATTLAALDLGLETYDADRVEGMPMSLPKLARWTRRLAAMSVAERRALAGMEAGRADVIVAGLLVLDGVLAAIGAEEFSVSGRGVRHGVALAVLDRGPPVW
jgi:exopolyphosphatase/guanosine-5'-triphosphate,3'-diphosphate pyrophosphatase